MSGLVEHSEDWKGRAIRAEAELARALEITPEMIRAGAAAIQAWEDAQPKNAGGHIVKLGEMAEVVLRAALKPADRSVSGAEKDA